MTEVKKRTVYVLSKKITDENYDVYVGSTTMSMTKRLYDHKYHCQQKFYDSKLYVRMRQVGLDGWKISPLYEKTCTKDEIRKVEKKWIEILDADLNKNSPFSDDSRERERQMRLQNRYVDEKRFFCEVCEKAFQSGRKLSRHKDSLKYQFTSLNSLD